MTPRLKSRLPLASHHANNNLARVSNRTRLSKIGNSRVRKALYFPAITALRYNPLIKSFAARLQENGKRPLQIVCAAMRKLLHIAFGVLKRQRPFNQNLALTP